MKTKTINSLGALMICMLLSACSRSKPETMSAIVRETSVIQPGSNSDFKDNVGDSVYFAYDKFNLSAEAQSTLRKQVEWLLKYPQYEVQIIGHCDERGSVNYNLGLGQRRSDAVKSFLIHNGIPRSRITTFSLGKEHPVNREQTKEGYAANRVAINFLAIDGVLIEKPAVELQTAGLIKQDGSVIQPDSLIAQPQD